MAENLTLIIVSLVSGLITLVVYVLYSNLKRSRYDSERNRVILEDMRMSMERKIYDLNDKLLRNDERWKDVNHLLIGQQRNKQSVSKIKKERTELSNFLMSNGIMKSDLVVEKGFVFVLTPFHPEFEKDFRTIQEICISVGLKCLRGDENHLTGDIFPEMLKLILKAELIIANINGRNPNVLYELGIAQMLDKPVILISKQPDNIPIDIKSRRFLIYNDYQQLKIYLKDELIKVFAR